MLPVIQIDDVLEAADLGEEYGSSKRVTKLGDPCQIKLCKRIAPCFCHERQWKSIRGKGSMLAAMCTSERQSVQ